MKKNFFYNFLLTSSNLLFPLLTFPYLSRILGAEGLGTYNFIMSYGQNFSIIAALGIPVYGIREIAKIGNDKYKRSQLFFEILTIHLVLTMSVLFFYISSIFLLNDLVNYKEFALVVGILIFSNVFSIEWLFAGINDFKFITIRSLIIRGLSLIAIFIFINSGEDLLIYFVITVLTVISTVALDVYYARKFVTRKVVLSLKAILSHIRPLAFLGVYMILTSIYSVLPTTLLGFLSTKSAVGYYFGASKIIRLVISVFTALIAVMIPRLNTSAEAKDSDEYLLLIDKSLNIVIIFGIPITFFVFLLADPIVMVLLGNNFTNSILVMEIMAPVILLVAFAQVFVLLILSVNRKDKQMVILSIIGMTTSLSINLLLIPSFAEWATGFSQLIAELFVTVISFLVARKIINFHFPKQIFLTNLLCVFPFAGISYVCNRAFESDIVILIVSALISGIYFILYQKFIIKNEFILKVFESFIFPMKNNAVINKTLNA